MTSPRVSIVIPMKNRRNLVAETLASIQRQTCPQWEAVVVDDGSTDGSAERVSELAAADPRIRLLRREGPTPGAPAARNQGFRASVAPYVIFFDSDDLLAPTCFEERLKVMEADPSLAFATWATEVFHDEVGDLGLYWNTITEENDFDRFLRADAPWSTEGPIWRRETVEKVGPWDEAAKRWQDWEFHVRATLLKLPCRKLPVVDHYYRKTRPGSISSTPHSRADAIARGELFLRVRKIVQAAGELTEQRDRVFLGLFQYLMRPYLEMAMDPGCAAILWRMCFRHGLINRARYLRGRYWIGLRQLPVIRWKIEKRMWASFPEAQLIDMTNRNRATTLTTEQ